MSTTGWVVLGIVVVIVIWAISIYNSLVAMRQRTNQAFADIDVQLKQRHDLIPNLVETVKGYAAHERGTLEAVVQARNAAIAAPGVEQKVAAENVLSGALRQLFALSENYPNLKANANFQQLQTDLSDIENKLAASRRFFNNAVQEYNTGIQQFPASLFAGAVRLHAAHVFRSRRNPCPARAGAEREVLDRFPGAAQYEVVCCRPGIAKSGFPNGPGSAAHRSRVAPRPGQVEAPWPPTDSIRISSRTSAARSRC